MLTGSSRVTLDVPRDRSGTFDPKLIAKYQRRFPDFDAKIILDVRAHLDVTVVGTRRWSSTMRCS